MIQLIRDDSGRAAETSLPPIIFGTLRLSYGPFHEGHIRVIDLSSEYFMIDWQAGGQNARSVMAFFQRTNLHNIHTSTK